MDGERGAAQQREENQKLGGALEYCRADAASQLKRCSVITLICRRLFSALSVRAWSGSSVVSSQLVLVSHLLRRLGLLLLLLVKPNIHINIIEPIGPAEPPISSSKPSNQCRERGTMQRAWHNGAAILITANKAAHWSSITEVLLAELR